MGDVFDMEGKNFFLGNFFFLVGFFEVFIFNLEIPLCNFYSLPIIDALNFFYPKLIIFLKKGLHFIFEKSFAYYSVKLKKVFFFSVFRKKIKIDKIYKKENLIDFIYLETQSKSLLKLGFLIKFLKASYFKFFFCRTGLEACILNNKIGPGLKNNILKNCLLKKILECLLTKLISFPFFVDVSTQIISILETTSQRIVLKIFYSTLFNLRFFPKKTQGKKWNINQKEYSGGGKVILDSWITNCCLVSFNSTQNLNSFNHFKKQLLTIFFLKKINRIQYICFHYRFIFFRNSKIGLDIWKKTFQENWSTFDPTFKQTNLNKITFFKRLLFFN